MKRDLPDIETPGQPVATQPFVTEVILSAAEKLSKFLQENDIVLKPTIMNEQCTIADGGIILNDKPLIKISVEYKESK
jgi:hypothetical protein